ncbi:PEP-CTERM sorting domain-containing protein [Singulisphaera sp. Ch08]|uniref:PEP-CTERM sorting domain-containing protein n=1 Tax=Singulisphaera sp. Ch08 TaxID=3120278 RepID=A0AAU7CDW8_9BACT
MSQLRSLIAWTLLFSGLSIGSARAAQIEMRTYQFEGTLDSVSDLDGIFDSSIQVGSSFSMTVSIPAATPNEHVGSNSQIFGTYNFPTDFPGTGISLSIDGKPVPVGIPDTQSSASINIAPSQNHFYGHQFFTTTLNDESVRQTRLEFDMNSVANALTSTALPNLLDLTDFLTTQVSLVMFQGEDPKSHASTALGHITSLEVKSEMVTAPVPEPGTGLIFGVAVLGFLGYRHRSRRPR